MDRLPAGIISSIIQHRDKHLAMPFSWWRCRTRQSRRKKYGGVWNKWTGWIGSGWRDPPNEGKAAKRNLEEAFCLDEGRPPADRWTPTVMPGCKGLNKRTVAITDQRVCWHLCENPWQGTARQDSQSPGGEQADGRIQVFGRYERLPKTKLRLG